MVFSCRWERARVLPCRAFGCFVRDCRLVLDGLAEFGIVFTGPFGEGVPVLSEEAVRFNVAPFLLAGGLVRWAPFELARVVGGGVGGGGVVGGCSVSYRPLVLAVQCCLIVARHHFGASFVVACSGGLAEWGEAIAFCEGVLGFGREFRLS
jgi:hypothetical protein